ncbi:hypothetical protein [Duganella sp. HH105]|uniref:hypothetical protein n=1 Tax=Duganella sp. HH105 TaxID=1781067 RepID=UPI00114C8E4B|nr:hypothetical protein [Duganella sp. HH105]
MRFLIALMLAASCHNSFAAPPDKFATKDELAQSQERLQKLENELAVQRHILQLSTEANDKRLADFGALATMQGSQTTWVGNIVAGTGVLITVIIALAGLGIYFSVIRLAKNEVRGWFSENAAELRKTIDDLSLEAEKARTGIAQHADQVADDARAAQEKIVAAERLMQLPISGATPAKSDDSASRQIVSQASADLTSKPESTFSASDYYIRGADLFADGKFESALDAFNGALRNASASTPDELAQYLFSKALTLRNLNRHAEELAIYEDMEKQFSTNTEPGVRNQLARALVNKGYRLQRDGRLEEASAVNQHIDTLYGQAPEPELRLLVAKALANHAFVLHKLSQSAGGLARCDEIERRYAEDINPDLRAMVAGGFLQKGYILAECRDFTGAIAAYETVEQRYGSDAHPAVHAEVMTAKNNKAITLEQMGRSDEAAAIHESLVPYLRASESLKMQGLLASALNGVGFKKLMNAKEQWHTDARHGLLTEAINSFDEARNFVNASNRATVLGNLGYVYHLIGNDIKAEKYTSDCLEDGKEQSLQAQQGDAKLHRVEPEDSAYERMLERLWQKISTKSPAA